MRVLLQQFLRYTFFIACFYCLGSSAAEESQPNILIILADDLGWKDVGYHGGPIDTPNIDRIANQGIELDRFYVQPTCSPTPYEFNDRESPYALGYIQATQ